MKRLAIGAAAVVVVVLAAGVWWFVSQRANGPSFAEQFPSVKGACPDDSNDLAGIEGWAPGAGQASKMSDTSKGNMGSFGAALGGSATTPKPAATNCVLLAPEAVAYFSRVDALRQAIPDDGDPVAIGASLADADAVFGYVRDRIRTEAYPGAMRGQLGALSSRGGSSADKALILGGLLGTKNVPARFVHTTLSPSDAARVVAAALAPSNDMPDEAGQQLAQKIATDFKVDLPSARADYQRGRAALEKQTDDALVSARSQVDVLAKQLADAKHPLASGDGQRATLLADVRDHWWVQANINGAWVDMDPTLPDAKPGSHIGGAPIEDPVTEIPESLDTSVTVRILAQTLDSSGLHDATVLEDTQNAQALYGHPISIGIGDRTNGTFDPAKATAFVPSIADKTGDPIIPDPTGGGARLATLRVQIVTTVPGAPPTTATRVLLDRRTADGKSIDPSWTAVKTAYAMTQQSTFLAMTGDFSDTFALKADLANTMRYGAAVAYGLAGGSGSQKAPADMGAAFPVDVMRFYQRDAAIRRRLEAGTGGLRFLYVAPVIVGLTRGYSLAGTTPKIVEKFDIVSNAMAAAGTADAATANAVRGYEDTVMEQQLLGIATDGGTPAYMKAAASAGVTTSVSTDPKYGGIAIVPKSPVTFAGTARIGWWQIDPASGNLVGRMDDGAGQALSEYVTQMNDAMSMYSAISFYADMLRCQVVGMTGPLRGEYGGDAAMTYLNCMKAAACSFLTGFAAGELYARQDADLQALAYNLLDLSFDTHLGPSKASWAPPGVWCSKFAPGP